MPKPAKNISLTSFAKGLLTFLLVAAVIGGYFFFQKDARQQAVARAQENLQSIAYALSIHVDGTLEQADHIGRVMRHHYVKGKDYEPKASAPGVGTLDFSFIASVPLEQVMTSLQKHQVVIIEGPCTKTGAMGDIRSVYFRDPDLNLVEVSEYL